MINQLLAIYLECKTIILLCVDFIAFIEYMLAGKILVDYTNLFSLNGYKKYKYYVSILRINMSSLEFRMTKIDETRRNKV